MNLQERVNCASLAAIVAALLLFAGHQLPPATASPTASATAAVQQVAAEEVSVDSESKPSGIRGLTEGELLRDAWTAHKAVFMADPAMPEPLVSLPQYIASYDGTAPAFPATFYSVPSFDNPGVTHVFQVVTGYKA